MQSAVIEGQTELRRTAVGRVNAVDQAVDFLPAQLVGCRCHFADANRRLQAQRLLRVASAGALDQVHRFTTPQARSDTVRQEGFHVDTRIRQQLIGHADNFRRQLVSTEGAGTELDITFTGGRVLAQQLTDFLGAVAGRPFDGVARISGQQLRHRGNTAIGFHAFENLIKQCGRYGITALVTLRRRLGAHFLQHLPLFRAQFTQAATHKGVKRCSALLIDRQLTVFAALLVSQIILATLDKRLIVRAQLFLTLDLLQEQLVPAAHFVPLGTLLAGHHFPFGNAVVEVAHFERQGSGFLLQFKQSHTVSLRAQAPKISSSRKRASRSLIARPGLASSRCCFQASIERWPAVASG